MTARWHRARCAGVELHCRDHGGEGPGVLLLHGLCGYAGEWGETASWLSRTHRVVVPDQRGHGRSERLPADMSRRAFVEDAAFWIERLQLAPAVVIGQSLGGHTAFLLAAARPDLVAGVVVAEATPRAEPHVPGTIARWLASWPLPFATRADAADFFGGGNRGRVWAAGLERRPRAGGLWPAFEPERMVAAVRESSERSHWREWAAVRCPALVVRARGGADARACRRMVAVAPQTRLITIAGGGHDIHLDRPDAWRATVEAFRYVVG